MTTEPKVVFQDRDIRITDASAEYWSIEWSYQGQRSDLIGAGWVAVLTGLLPDGDKRLFQRQFIDRRTNLVNKSACPILIEFRDIYPGGSKYQYDKPGGKMRGFMRLAPDGSAEEIAAKDAVIALQG